MTEDWYYVSHRLELGRAAVAAGYRVVVATRVQHQGAAIRASGCELRPLNWRRSGNTPWSHWQALREVIATVREVRPDLIHLVALKPVVLGGLAARWCAVPARVSALAGLGFAFSSPTLRARVLRLLLLGLLRVVLGGNTRRVIVQNREDGALVARAGLVPPDQIRLIRGAGVPSAALRARPAADGVPTIVLVSRMLWDKGVAEFVAAAGAIRALGTAGRFVLVGAPDPDSPSAIPCARLAAWHESGVIEWWGQRADVPEILAQSSIFCLPTRYGEGIPRSILEAAAAGLAVVATNIPGCREVIRHGENGLLVPPGDHPALVSALSTLLADPPLRARLGEAARQTVEREFSLEQVIGETLAVYRELLP